MTLKPLLLAAQLAAASLAAHASGTRKLSPSTTTADAGDSIVIGDHRHAGFTDRVIGGGFSLSFDAQRARAAKRRHRLP